MPRYIEIYLVAGLQTTYGASKREKSPRERGRGVLDGDIYTHTLSIIQTAQISNAIPIYTRYDM